MTEGDSVLFEENRRLFDLGSRLLLERNELQKRVEYLAREIRENNARIFKKKIPL